MSGVEDNWQRDLVDGIKESYQVTELNKPTVKPVSRKHAANYNTFELSTHLKLDVGNTDLISGTESSIMQQASLLKAIHNILGRRLGFLVDFDIWFQDFSREFKVNPLTGMPRFPVENPDKLTYWGKDRDSRPKFEWIHPKNIQEPTTDDELFFRQCGYFVIKFWRNRNELEDFDFVAGSLPEIRDQLIRKMEKSSGEGDETGDRQISESKLLSGFPSIHIKFWQVNPVPGKRTRYDSIPSITLVGWGESVEDNLPTTLSITDLKQFKRKIEELFYPGGFPHILKRGRETYSYQDWKKGYATYTHFRNEAEALSFYQKLVQVKGDVFDPKRVGIGRKLDESQFTNPSPATVLNETKSTRNYRPIVDLEFWQAWVWLPRTEQKIILCSRSKQTPVDPRLL